MSNTDGFSHIVPSCWDHSSPNAYVELQSEVDRKMGVVEYLRVGGYIGT